MTGPPWGLYEDQLEADRVTTREIGAERGGEGRAGAERGGQGRRFRFFLEGSIPQTIMYT